MPIQFICPHCGAETNLADEYAGQSGPCAQCGKTITVPPVEPLLRYANPPKRSSRGQRLWILAMRGVLLLVCAGIVVEALLTWAVVEPAKEAARRAMCANNLRQIALAMQTYHDSHKCFPPAYIADENGRPMHSWRVLLLPDLFEEALYRQYDFTQPWDSPNNLALAKTTPDCYRCPSDSGATPSETSYVMVVGPGTISDGPTPVRRMDVHDGTSRTIAVVEMCQSGINWLEPRDLNFEEMTFKLNNPAGKAIRSKHPAGANVSFADGDAKFVSEDADPQEIKALITISGGELVQGY